LLTLGDHALELRDVLFAGFSRSQHRSKRTNSFGPAFFVAGTLSALFEQPLQRGLGHSHETADLHMIELARPYESPHGLRMATQAMGDFLNGQ
jgi:hypothetical protein